MSVDPFCTKSETDKTVFYESASFMVLYDIKPVVRGHCLFIPKRHVVDLPELKKHEQRELWELLCSMIPRILKIYVADGNSYDLTSQIGPYSGRTIAHLHIHLLPRRKDDIYQSDSKNIFEDIKLNRSSFSSADVQKEVSALRKEFGYRGLQK